MASDNLLPGPPQEVLDKIKATQTEKKEKTFIVSAVKVKNDNTDIVVRASGVTEPIYTISVIARRSGIVTDILVTEGMNVKKGQIIATLDKENLDVDLEAAISAEKSAQQSFDIAEKLGKNYASNLELVQSEAALKQAKAQVAGIKQQIEYTKLKAQKSGILEELFLETGQLIQKDRSVFTIMGMEKMKLIAPVPQTQIGKISLNDNVVVTIPGIEEKIGKVKRIASAANQATRTFDVEVEIENEDGSVRAGMSSEVSIVIDQAKAFSVSPAHLAISEDGSLRVKIVNDQNVVSIVDVKLIRASGNMAYVSGLNDGDLMLTTGQAFVSAGEKITYEMQEDG
tara:strand:- start:1253 stop:2275 length:1023 start_codon:yes stop_codon:yes gene_type:complete